MLSRLHHTEMRVLFVQWRYHPNRHPIIKSLIESGHQVEYYSLYTGPSEDYSALTPYVIGYSGIFKSIKSVTPLLQKMREYRVGWPPLFELFFKIYKYSPDVIIVRDYTITSAISLFIGNLLGSDGILQQQIPLCEKESGIKKLINKTYNNLFKKPLVRVTPLKGSQSDFPPREQVYYVPFTVDLEKYTDFEQKSHFRHGRVNIISVGKLDSERKNHLTLLSAINIILKEYDLKLKLVGSLDDTDNSYYKRIKNYIDYMSLSDHVSIAANMKHDDLQAEYSYHDLFVLPSANEPAAISPLEAMAAGLPVVCSDTNGTSEYINDRENGIVFDSTSQQELERALTQAVSDRRQLIRMGEEAVKTVKSRHHPDDYASAIESIVEENFD